MDDQASTQQLNFSGSSKAECQNFVREVRRLAFASGKSRDDEWMADLAAAHMADDALEWHMDLDPNVQGSWILLQKALFEKYARSSTPTETSKVPTPAHAPSTSASGPITATSSLPPALEKGMFSRTGRIAVMDTWTPSSSTPNRWIANNVGSTGMFYSTTSQVEAALVRFVPSTAPHDIYIVNPAGASTCLSLTAMTTDNNAYASIHDSVLNASAPGFDAGSRTASYTVCNVRYTATAVWSVAADGGLAAIVDGTPRRTEFCANAASGNLYAPVSASQLKKRFSTQEYKLHKLVFIPI